MATLGLPPGKKRFVPGPAKDVKKQPGDNSAVDKFFKNAMFEKREVELNLADGTVQVGLISKFDKYTIVVNNQGIETLVFKAYIVTANLVKID